jgi:hypothetical protein
MNRWIICGLLCVAAAGVAMAASSTKDKQKALDKAQYIAYQGPQQAWPTSEAALPSTIPTKYGVVIYRSLPAKPYEIMGLIHIVRDSAVRRAADAAEAAGADAILVCPHEAYVKAGITTPLSVTSKGDSPNTISALTGLLIRWKAAAP